MFTGLIEEIGQVKNKLRVNNSMRLKISAQKILSGIKLGDSISTNGVCLTITSFGKDYFEADLMAETIRYTSFENIEIGAKVNLERALKLGDRFGGHIVSGHIDGKSKIKSIKKEDFAIWIEIEAIDCIKPYLVKKGSIAIDGTSLTIAEIGANSFFVSIIPKTQEETTLTSKTIGEWVNLEADAIGKYVFNMMSTSHSSTKKTGMTMDFLRENGYA